MRREKGEARGEREIDIRKGKLSALLLYLWGVQNVNPVELDVE